MVKNIIYGDNDMTTWGFVSQRFDDMRSARSDFDQRWRRNNEDYYSYRIPDLNGELGLPTVKTIVDKYVSEIARNDDSVIFKPTIEKKSENKQYEQLTKVFNQEEDAPNIDLQKKLAKKDACIYGIGVIFEGYINTGEVGSFSGLITERVDPRDCFFDESALVHHDRYGNTGMADFIRRRYYPAQNFKKAFSSPIYNQKAVKEAAKNFTVKQQENTSEVDDQHDQDLIEVYEYWSKDKLIIVPTNTGNPIFDGKNPYGDIPFVIYVVDLDAETLYPSSIPEIIAPITSQIELLYRVWYQNTKLSAANIIFADEDTGLIPGADMRSGIQLAKLDGQDIRTKIQQFSIENKSPQIQTYMNFLDDLLTISSSVDRRALLSKPDELATQTKVKTATELKRILDIINTITISADEQRALLRAKNIIKFVFAKTKDVIINDVKEEKSGSFKDVKGSNVTININPSDWVDFEFNVKVEPKVENDQEKQEELRSIMEFYQTTQLILSDPNTPQDIRQRFNYEVLIEEIASKFPSIDLSKIFEQKDSKSRLKNDLEKAMRGESFSPEIKTQEEKDETVSSVSKTLASEKDPIKKMNLAKFLLKSNAKNIGKTERNSEEIITEQ